MSSSLGRPPAVTSEARVKVQYDSLLLVGAMISFAPLLVKGRDTSINPAPSLAAMITTALALPQPTSGVLMSVGVAAGHGTKQRPPPLCFTVPY